MYYPVAFSRLLYRKGITCFINDITFQKRICMFDSEITCLTKACICINENTHIFSSDIVERRSRRTNKKKHHVSTVRIKMCNALPKKDRFKNSILLIKRITQKLLQSRARQAAVMKRWLPCPFFWLPVLPNSKFCTRFFLGLRPCPNTSLTWLTWIPYLSNIEEGRLGGRIQPSEGKPTAKKIRKRIKQCLSVRDLKKVLVLLCMVR